MRGGVGGVEDATSGWRCVGELFGSQGFGRVRTKTRGDCTQCVGFWGETEAKQEATQARGKEDGRGKVILHLERALELLVEGM